MQNFRPLQSYYKSKATIRFIRNIPNIISLMLRLPIILININRHDKYGRLHPNGSGSGGGGFRLDLTPNITPFKHWHTLFVHNRKRFKYSTHPENVKYIHAKPTYYHHNSRRYGCFTSVHYTYSGKLMRIKN